MLCDNVIILQEFWTINSPLQSTLILLVEHIAVALGAEFKIYLPQLMPQILRVLMHDTSKDRTVTVKVRDSMLVPCSA
jgi:FKBP12-rapamycin complex-associated protein